LKNLLLVLALLAIAILIEFLIEDQASKQDMVNIVGFESDSAGGGYIYFDNGDVYHRRSASDRASSPNNQGHFRNSGIEDGNQKVSSDHGPSSSSKPGSEDY
jgi:hypothetical protein